ncbi:MAG: helix-turn-helix transcriptional regulator [Amaricoccus sp.]|nr:helix-turn-helix transcriptional regulator [Amaricoccus sp.]
MSTGVGSIMSSVGTRLKEERERLSISQQKLAGMLDIDRKTQRRYETDENSPDTKYLAEIEKIGFDIVYVLNGRRTPGLGLVREVRRKFGPVLDMGEVGEEIDRLMQAEIAAGAARDRDDLDRLARAIATVNEGLVGLPPISAARRAGLILAAYDLLEEGDASSRDRVIRLVKTS